MMGDSKGLGSETGFLVEGRRFQVQSGTSVLDTFEHFSGVAKDLRFISRYFINVYDYDTGGERKSVRDPGLRRCGAWQGGGGVGNEEEGVGVGGGVGVVEVVCETLGGGVGGGGVGEKGGDGGEV